MILDKIASSTNDKELALSRLNKALEIRPNLILDQKLLRYLSVLFVSSESLSIWLLTRANELDYLIDHSCIYEPKGRSEFERSFLETEKVSSSAYERLRIFKHRELARIALRELNDLESLRETLYEWSIVADVAISEALKVSLNEISQEYEDPFYKDDITGEIKPAKFAVIGMGKLGGMELNISSDVDLMYLHSSNNGRVKSKSDKSDISLHEYFVKVAGKIGRLLNDITEYGYCFRVDNEIRPNGKSGELSNSIDALEIYYESWGQTWERQAHIKGRYIAGDKSLADDLILRLFPFVYRKYFDKDAIVEIAVIKNKIDAKLKRGMNAAKAKNNIKLGEGGIREIEFVVQTLQLLSGGKYPELRVRSTLEALDILYKMRKLSRPHYKGLKNGYMFFRKIENRIQYTFLNQTHQIPDSRYWLELLAWQLGIGSDDKVKELQKLIALHRSRVRKIFNLLFSSEERDHAGYYDVPIEKDELEHIASWLDSLKFDHPLDSAKRLVRLKFGKDNENISEKSITTFDKFGPNIIKEAAETLSPDTVLVRLEMFTEKTSKSRDILYKAMADNTKQLKLLAELFAASERLSELLIINPDLVSQFLILDSLNDTIEREKLRKDMQKILSLDIPVEHKLARLNMFKTIETLRLGISSILGIQGKFQIMEGISNFADEYTKALFDLAIFDLAPKLERIPKEFTLLVCGKLARAEMSFGSDTDIVLFYDEKEEDPLVLTKIIQHLIKFSKIMTSNDKGFDIDMRLRPEGATGPIVTSFDFANQYYKSRAKAWEKLAFVGTRSIYGSEQFGMKVKDLIADFVYNGKLTDDERDQLCRLREKGINETRKKNSINIKFGRGGLLDIEFIAESFVIDYHPLIKRSDKLEPLTYAALNMSFGREIIDEETHKKLVDGYEVYRSIETAIRLGKSTALNDIPINDENTFLRIARMAGLKAVGPHRFLDHIRKISENVTEIFNKVFNRKG